LNHAESQVAALGLVCVAAFAWWICALPMGAVTIEHPTPTRVEYVEGYRVVAYVEGSVDVVGYAGQVCFDATLGDLLAYRFFGWRVWEPLN
jgi:hypothetical protein